MCLRHRLISRVENVPNDHANVALAILASVRLRCLAPSAVEQRADRRYSRALALALRGDDGEVADTRLGMSASKAANIQHRLGHILKFPTGVIETAICSPTRPSGQVGRPGGGVPFAA